MLCHSFILLFALLRVQSIFPYYVDGQLFTWEKKYFSTSKVQYCFPFGKELRSNILRNSVGR